MKIKKIIIEILEATKDGKHNGWMWDCYNCSRDSGSKEFKSYREALKAMKTHAAVCRHRTLDTDDLDNNNGTVHLPFAVFHFDY